MKSYIKLLACLGLIVGIPIFGMEPAPQSKTQAFISSQDDIPKMITQAIKKGNFVFFDSYVFTHQKVQDALNDTHYVQGNVGRHPINQHVLASLIKAKKPIQLQCFTDLHVKRMFVCEKDPRTKRKNGRRVSIGWNTVIDTSANLTYNAYHNLETAITTENDSDYFMQHFNDHKYVTGLVDKENRSPIKTKQIIDNTPTKRKVYNSRHSLLASSKAKRIKKLLQSKNENRALYVTSMNWLNQEVTDAVVAVHKDGVATKIIINGTALKSGKMQLDQLHQAGVLIYVFDPENKVRHVQHSKVLLRIDGDQSLLINSTANITPQGEREINIDCYHPQDMQAVITMRNALDQYAKTKCVEYGKI